MPKFLLQWKDPDFGAGEDLYEDIMRGDDEASDELHEKLGRLGIEEYLLVEVDTDAMTTKIVAPRGRA